MPIAKLGFHVSAIDTSKVGLDQLGQIAHDEHLAIETALIDLAEYAPRKPFDVLLADRTFHMMKPAPRHACLARCLGHANPGAQALLVDERRNLPGLKTVFDQDDALWQVTFEEKGFLFLQREA